MKAKEILKVLTSRRRYFFYREGRRGPKIIAADVNCPTTGVHHHDSMPRLQYIIVNIYWRGLLHKTNTHLNRARCETMLNTIV